MSRMAHVKMPGAMYTLCNEEYNPDQVRITEGGTAMTIGFRSKDQPIVDWLKQAPSLLVAVRVLLGPMLLLMTVNGVAGVWLIVGLTTAFLTDVFDGIIARRIGGGDRAIAGCG